MLCENFERGQEICALNILCFSEVCGGDEPPAVPSSSSPSGGGVPEMPERIVYYWPPSRNAMLLTGHINQSSTI